MRRRAAGVLLALLAASVAQGTPKRKPRIAIVSLHLAEFPNLARAAASRDAGREEVALFGLGGGLLPSIADTDLGGYDLVVIEGVGSRLLDFKAQVERTKARTRVLVIEQTAWVQGNVEAKAYPELADYWANGTEENYARLFDYLATRVLGVPGSAKPPVVAPAIAWYHPDHPEPFASLADYLAWQRTRLPDADRRPRIGLSFFRSLALAGNAAVPDALIREIERQGGLPMPAWRKDSTSSAFDAPFSADGRPAVDAMILCASQINYAASAEGVAATRRLNVPVLSCDTDWYRTPAQWEASLDGIGARRGGELTLGEGDGIVEPITVGARAIRADGSAATLPIDHQVAWRVRRAMAWARLKRLENADKRLVIPYFSETASRGDVGADTDTYLDAQGSLVALLARLRTEGYDLGSEPLPDRAELARRMAAASNAAIWAPTGLEAAVRAGTVLLIPEAQYRAWYETLPEADRKLTEARWGPPPGRILVRNADGGRAIAIPLIRFGKVALVAHPTWGYRQDRSTLADRGALPPHHQYAAFYLWLQHGWKADATVALFDQLSLMPGKQEAPSSEDWVAQLVGDVPRIAPVALQANGGVGGKRRSENVSIGFMPAIVRSGLPPALADLRARLARLDAQPAGAVGAQAEAAIRRDVAAAGLGRDLALDPRTAAWAELESALEAYLAEVDRAAMPFGAHVLGAAPDVAVTAQMVQAMLGQGTTALDQVRKALAGAPNDLSPEVATKALDYGRRIAAAPRELDAIVGALAGGYVEPGPMEDALRNPDALPPGRNPFFLDVRSMPTREAWTVGSRLADTMLADYRAGRRALPRRVAFVLWSAETTQNGGVLEAEILRVLGAHPVWNPKGQVSDVALDDRAILGRPRIDVLVTTSGTYRDHFRGQLDLLAKAVRLAAAAPEPDNAVRLNGEAVAAGLRARGVPAAEAQVRATRRIFSNAPGAYSPNTQFALEAGGREAQPGALAALYTGRLGHAWGGGDEGVADEEAFRGALKTVDASMFSRASSVYGLLDDAMPAAYVGGLSQAARAAGGQTVTAYISNLQEPQGAKVETVQRFYARELRSRYLNPAWIRGMQASGYAGARYMAELGKNLLLWNVTTPGMVTAADWRAIRDVYVRDRYKLGLAQWFARENPDAARELAHALQQAAARRFWDPRGIAEVEPSASTASSPGRCLAAACRPGEAARRSLAHPAGSHTGRAVATAAQAPAISGFALEKVRPGPRSYDRVSIVAALATGFAAAGLMILGGIRRPRW